MAQDKGPLPSGDTIAVLPAELLTIILTIVRNSTSAKQYLDTLLCCRQWWTIGKNILYRDIALTSGTIATFIEKFPPKSLSAICTITISVDSRDGKLRRDLARDPRGPWLIIAALRQLTRLRTFSFTVLHRSHADGSPYCPTRSSYIRALLDHLPEGVSNLNLDVVGYGAVSPLRRSAQNIIEEIPPQIVTLRLRLGSLKTEKILEYLSLRQRALKSLHMDIYAPKMDLESPILNSTMLTTGFDRLTSTHTDFLTQLNPNGPFEFQFTNHVMGYRTTMAGRATRVFASSGDGTWNCLPRLALTLTPSKPDVLTPRCLEAILSAIAGWYRTATGSLLLGFQDDHGYDLWPRMISKTFSDSR